RLGREGSVPLSVGARRISGEEESAPRLWNRTTEFAGGFDPLLDDGFHILQRLHARTAVCSASGQLWDFRDERFVLGAPVEDDLVFRHSIPPASLYRTMTARTCLT